MGKPTIAGRAVAAMPERGVGLDIAQPVHRATDRDWWAWERLIDQYGRLIWATAHDFNFSESDAAQASRREETPCTQRRLVSAMSAH